MDPAYRDLFKKLKSRIRDFEDRRISMADLGREVFHTAREIQADDDANLRRALERLANRLTVLSEESRSSNARSQAIELVDELNSHLIDAT